MLAAPDDNWDLAPGPFRLFGGTLVASVLGASLLGQSGAHQGNSEPSAPAAAADR
jgi:hypothetical protein